MNLFPTKRRTAAGDCGRLILCVPASGGFGDGGFVAGSFTNILGSGGSGSDRIQLFWQLWHQSTHLLLSYSFHTWFLVDDLHRWCRTNSLDMDLSNHHQPIGIRQFWRMWWLDQNYLLHSLHLSSSTKSISPKLFSVTLPLICLNSVFDSSWSQLHLHDWSSPL